MSEIKVKCDECKQFRREKDMFDLTICEWDYRGEGDDIKSVEKMTEQKTQQTQQEQGVEFEYKLFNVYEAIRHLDTIKIKATEKGLEIWGLDAGNTMMTIVEIDKEDLSNYKFNKETEITTDTDYFKIVKRLYMVKAYLEEKRVIFEENNTRIEMPTFEQQDIEKPNLDLKKEASFNLLATDLRKVLKDIEAVGSDDFYLEFKDKKAIITAIGRGGMNFTKKLYPAEEGIKKFEKKKDSIKVGLSVELMRNALNGSKGEVRITIAENSPIIVENVIDEYNRSNEKVRHYIAPRVSDDY